MKEHKEAASATPTKRAWQKMELSYLGNAVELIQMPGGGKISGSSGDTGDPRKTPGSG
jgi:hypothetical protein